MVMAKAAVGVNATVFGTASSVGLPAVYAQAITPVTAFTAHQNPDHSAVKDTRS